MSIERWSDNIVLVNLAKEPQLGEELQMVTAIIADENDCDVVVDFSDIEILTSSSIAKMLKLRKIIRDAGRNLLLSAVSRRTKEVFVITGIDSVFNFVDDKTLALASLQLNIQNA
jgi:anti-anti-sigma factor